MAAFAFTLPILPGQEEVVRRIGEAVSGELREEYDESRRRLGISEEKIWVQRTPIGQALVVYWDTEDPQRTLRDIADAQGEFGEQVKQLVQRAAPAPAPPAAPPLCQEGAPAGAARQRRRPGRIR